MSICTSCKETYTSCTCSKPCGCPIEDLSTDCVKYDGPSLDCSGATTPDILTNVIKKIDTFICEKLENTFIGELINIGSGAQIYKQTNSLTGRQEVRTILSSDDTITVVQEDNHIDIKTRAEALEDTFLDSVNFESGNLQFNLNDGTSFPVNISAVDTNTFLQNTDFNISNGTITLEMSDSTVFTIDISDLQQTQSNVIVSDSSDPAFIKNKNPQKVISTDYTLTPEDNNYLVILDTTQGDITVSIDVAGQNLPKNYFVGFIQEGTGQVQFTGYDTKPQQYTDILQGQGHNAGVEVYEFNNGLKSLLTGSLSEIP